MVGEVFTLVADAWCPPDGLKRIEQFRYPAIGGVDVVLMSSKSRSASRPRASMEFKLTPTGKGAKIMSMTITFDRCQSQ
jgi:hypothetical protein